MQRPATIATCLSVLALLALVLVVPRTAAPALASRSADRQWIVAWTASPQGPFPFGHTFDEPPLQRVFRGGVADDQTLRLIVHSAADGDRVRIRLSNAFGTAPLTIGAADVGLRAYGAALVPGSNRHLTFDGRSTVTIPPGREVYSDPVALTVAAQQDLAISLYVPAASPPMTWHASAFTTSYSTAPGGGNDTDDPTGAAFAYTMTSWFWLDAVDLYSTDAGAVVVLGDSITDGWVSTIDGNNRWPDVLARRLLRLPPGRRDAVVDAGIAGNMIEPGLAFCPRCGPPALQRLDRDVLSQPGVRAVILFEGINDINHGASAARLIAAMRAIVRRVRARGLRIYGVTLLPDGRYRPRRPWPCRCTPAAHAAVLNRVNAYIRARGSFDAVIDANRLLSDPAQPAWLNPRFDSGDHLHPNAAGLQVIGDAAPLSLFASRAGARPTPHRRLASASGRRYAG